MIMLVDYGTMPIDIKELAEPDGSTRRRDGPGHPRPAF